MKWPLSLTIIRHGKSAYNALRDRKKLDIEYEDFVRQFDAQVHPIRLQPVARRLQARFATRVSDYATPLTSDGKKQAFLLGEKILTHVPMPHVILVSPYLRTRETLKDIKVGAASDSLNAVPVVHEDRIREQEHGLSLLYNDWRIFQTIHPEQRALFDLLGPYWYQYPQGESVSMVRDRLRSIQDTLIREYAGKHVWMVSHHLTKLAIRANLERLSPEQFVDLDNHNKPINCGVTLYRGDPMQGREGKLVLEFYNRKLW